MVKRIQKSNKKKRSTVSKVSKASAVVENTDNIAGVRDLIFGDQMRDYEKRFDQLNHRLLQDVNSLKADVRNQVESLERHFNDELASLNDRLTTEQTDRENADKNLGQQISELTNAVEQKCTQLQENLTKTEQNLRERLLNETKALRNEFQAKFAEQAATLDRELKLLHDVKTDRAVLADLFKEFALRLTGDLELPIGSPSKKNVRVKQRGAAK